MRYDFDQILDRRNTSCEKWDYVGEVFGCGSADVLPMWVADMDFPAPPPVMEAIARRAEHGAYGYTAPPASYYDAVVGWVGRRHGWDIRPEWIMSTPGVVPALAVSVLAFTQPGDGVIVQPPVYPPFFRVVENNGRRLLMNQLKMADAHYEMDWDDLDKKLDSGARLLLLCNPANPVGRVWTREELERVSRMCGERNVIVVSDEIHSDIVYPGYRHIPFSSLGGGARDRSATLIAPSKTFNIPGLTTSIAILPNGDLRAGFDHVLKGLGLTGGNVFGITALEAAYAHGDEWLDQVIAYIEANLRYMEDFIEKRIPGITVVPAEAMYVVWLDCRGLGLSQGDLMRLMLDEAKVAMNDGTMFGPGGEGFLRINIACPRSVLVDGLERIERAVRGAA